MKFEEALGLGYVGLTEPLELAHAGFPVTGFDFDRLPAEQTRTPVLCGRPPPPGSAA